MERMIITIHCSTHIMATGNKGIFICPPINKKMFPFTESLSCNLPIGETTNLQKLLKDIEAFHLDDLVILGPANEGIEAIANAYHAKFLRQQENFILQLYDEMKTCENLIIIYADCFLHIDDLTQLINCMKTNTCGALIKEYDKYTQTIDTIGVYANEYIHEIYAHPREHYVNAHVCGAYVWNQQMRVFAEYCEKGFHNINCGQMPDASYYVEEVMQNAIEQSVEFHSVYSKNSFIKLEFPWNLAEANERMCLQLNSMTEHKLQEDTILDSSCKLEGYIACGNHVVIQDGVFFEGNCIIGNHVTIEKGAIIGKNCIIKDGSVIQYQCRIQDHTVIGKHNKIGYHAEVSGVTFDGVCAVHGCEVFGIIGKKVDIAAGVRMAILRFDDTLVKQRVQKKIYANTYTNRIFIGNYCRTGVNNVFLPGVKIGSRSAIGPSVLIEKDIEENSLILLKQEILIKEWGSKHYGW